MLCDYLEEFAVIAQEGTLSGAAAKLGISQPSLGRHLSTLESELRAKLVERGSGGVRLTEDGRIALQTALDITALEESVIRHFSDDALREQERCLLVGVLCESRFAADLIGRACASLNEQGYGVSARFLQPNSFDSASSSLARHDVDMLVTFSASAEKVADDDAYLCVHLADVPAVAVLEPRHPFAGRGSIDVVDLRSCRFVGVSGTANVQTATWAEFRRACEAHGFSPIARTMHNDQHYGFDIASSEEVSVCVADSDEADRRRAFGQVLVPIAGISLLAHIIVRRDDGLAVRLVQRARELADRSVGLLTASHQSMYGNVAKNDAAAVRLDYGTRGKLLAEVLDEPRVDHDLILPDGTVVDRAYVALRNRLNRMADGLSNDPVATSYEAIMNLWTVEEARAELEMPSMRWFTAYDYAAESGHDLAWCEEMLSRLAARRLVRETVRGGTRYYCLLAWLYGIWEASVKRYDDEFLSWGIYGSDRGTGSQYPVMYACPVSAEVVEGGSIVAYRDWEAYIRRQTVACVAPCQCHRANDILHPDDHDDAVNPMEICLTFGEMAEFWIERAGCREVSIDECLGIARNAVFECGLVPQLYFSKNPEVMCFCRSDCCYVLGAVKASGGMTSTMPHMSAYLLKYDAEKCVGCGACVKRCPMGAVSMNAGMRCEHDKTCVACGQCALVCPAGARTLAAKAPDQISILPDDFVESYRWRSEDRMAKGYISDFTGSRLPAWKGEM